MGHGGKIISSSLTPIHRIFASYGGVLICFGGVLVAFFVGIIPGLLMFCSGIALIVTWWKLLREAADVYLDVALHIVKRKKELAVPYSKIINVRKINGLRLPLIAVDYSIDGKKESVVFIPSHRQFYPLLGAHRIDLIELIKGKAHL